MRVQAPLRSWRLPYLPIAESALRDPKWRPHGFYRVLGTWQACLTVLPTSVVYGLNSGATNLGA